MSWNRKFYYGQLSAESDSSDIELFDRPPKQTINYSSEFSYCEWSIRYFLLALNCSGTVVQTLVNISLSPLLKWNFWCGEHTRAKVIEINSYRQDGRAKLVEELVDIDSPVAGFTTLENLSLAPFHDYEINEDFCSKRAHKKLYVVDNCLSDMDLSLDQFDPNTTFVISDTVACTEQGSTDLLDWIPKIIKARPGCRIIIFTLGANIQPFGLEWVLSQSGESPQCLAELEADFCLLDKREDQWVAHLPKTRDILMIP